MKMSPESNPNKDNQAGNDCNIKRCDFIMDPLQIRMELEMFKNT